jgi:hypothetical protein
MEIKNNLVFNKERLIENINYINYFLLKHEMNWTFVIKAFNSYPDYFIEEIAKIPCSSFASDNENHLEIIKRQNSKVETWFINYSGEQQYNDFIDVNLTHSHEFISDKTCLMLALDPERYGSIYNPDFSCKRFGAYLDCTEAPDISFYDLWAELGISPLLTQSLGTSVSFDKIDLLKSKGVNHFRLGELVLTGKSLIDGTNVKGLRQDVFMSNKSLSYHIISNLNL